MRLLYNLGLYTQDGYSQQGYRILFFCSLSMSDLIALMTISFTAAAAVVVKVTLWNINVRKLADMLRALVTLKDELTIEPDTWMTVSK